jgi:hypothetical protein
MPLSEEEKLKIQSNPEKFYLKTLPYIESSKLIAQVDQADIQDAIEMNNEAK